MNLNFSLYRFVTEEEQAIFKQLIGDAFETEALLVSTLETKSYTEYIFIYNHPTEEINNLVSFYGKVKKSNSDEIELLKFATAQFTEKMITSESKVKENRNDTDIVFEIAKNIKYTLDESHIVGTEYSQKHYQLNNKGSFAAICKTSDYYYILTAHHCIEGNQNLHHCSSDNKETYKLVIDSTCIDVNKEMLENGLDAGLYRIDYREDFTKTNLFLKRFSLSNYTDTFNSKMCFHDSDTITFKEYNKDCKLVYYNSFYINEGLNLGNSGGLAHKENKLTGVISGYNDETKLGRITCGYTSNPNCNKSKKSIKSILDSNKVELT